MIDNDRLIYLHNLGQTHASEGKDKPPHDGFEMTLLGMVGMWTEMYKDAEAENEAYQAGQINYENQ